MAGPGPQTNRLLADLVMKGGSRLLRLAVDRTLLKPAGRPAAAPAPAPSKARPEPEPKAARSITGKVFAAAASRIALRSVPGAILIGGGLLAKTLHDRRKARTGAKKGG